MNLLTFIINFLYPNHCLHCFNKVTKKYFCDDCLQFFSYIYPKNNLFYFSVFEKQGAVISLLKEMKKMQSFGLIKLAASFIVIQHYRLSWDIPDIVIPMRKSKYFKDHMFYLAKEVAKFFNKSNKNKKKSKQIVLFVDDEMSINNIEIIKKENNYKKKYYLSLCFDIFFDDFNLSE